MVTSPIFVDDYHTTIFILIIAVVGIVFLILSNRKGE